VVESIQCFCSGCSTRGARAGDVLGQNAAFRPIERCNPTNPSDKSASGVRNRGFICFARIRKLVILMQSLVADSRRQIGRDFLVLCGQSN
jgi:hypothetical protein